MNTTQGAAFRAVPCPLIPARDFEFTSKDRQILVFEEHGRYLLAKPLVLVLRIMARLILTCLWW